MPSCHENIKVELVATVVSPGGYPNLGLPEIAVIGRSNVGKSSFINTVLNKKSLAKTSGAPGKTRTINFYQVENSFFLVDLPGYGYAKLSKSESAKWAAMVECYLKNRNRHIQRHGNDNHLCFRNGNRGTADGESV